MCVGLAEGAACSLLLAEVEVAFPTSALLIAQTAKLWISDVVWQNPLE